MSHTHTQMLLLLLLLLLWSLKGFNVRLMSMSCNKSLCHCGRLDNVCSSFLSPSLSLSAVGEFMSLYLYIVSWPAHQFNTTRKHINIHTYTYI